MAKKDKNAEKKNESKNDKNVVTIKIPSINAKNGLKYAFGLALILLAVSLFFNLRGGFARTGGKVSLAGLVYICPTGNCDTTQVNGWSKDLGFGVTPYEASWANGPIGLLFSNNNSVEILDVSTQDGFYTTVCDSTKIQKACDAAKAAQKQTAEKSCETVKKAQKPELEAFVVSYCPYGLQMQRTLVPINDLIGKVANIKVRYIGSVENGKITSMHGDQEAQENLKQICIREEQADKYWKYLSCFMKATGKSENCSKEVGIDTSKLEVCMTKGKGLEYAKVDFASQNKYGVSGSPSLFLNGEKVSEFNFGGRTAEAVKTMICCGMSQKAKECDTALSTDQANTAFAEQYSSGSVSGTGSC